MAKTNIYQMHDNVVAVGPSPSKQLPTPMNDHTVECSYIDANASVSVVVVDLEMTLDPPEEINDATAKWVQMRRHTFTAGEITAKLAVFIQLNIPAQRVRVNLITATGADGTSDKFSSRYLPRYPGRS